MGLFDQIKTEKEGGESTQSEPAEKIENVQDAANLVADNEVANTVETKAEPKEHKEKKKEPQSVTAEKITESQVVVDDADNDDEPTIPEGYVSKEELDSIKSELDSYMSDPILKELIELRKSGKAITKDLLIEGFEDYSSVNVDDINLAKAYAKKALIAQGMSDREAEIVMRKQYKFIGKDNDELTEDEVEEKEYQEVQIKKTAKEFLEKKKQDQVNLRNIDVSSTSKDEIEREVGNRMNESATKQAELLKTIATNVTEKVTKVDYEVKYKDGDAGEVKIPYQVEVTSDMKKQIRKELQDPTLFNYIYRDVNKSATREEQEREIMSKAIKFIYPDLTNQLAFSKLVSDKEKKWLDNDLTHRSRTIPAGSGGDSKTINIGKSKFAQAYAKAAAEN